VAGLMFKLQSFRFDFQEGHLRNRRQRGYVLLTLLLTTSLLVVAAAVVAPMITLQIKRDREEELIHRGMEYRRAIRAYVKHTGNFPLSLDQLENASGNRYLRRRYKDPMTGKDFRLLHMDDVAKATAGANPLGTPIGGSANSGTGNSSNDPSSASNPADSAANQNAGNAQAATPGSPAPPASSSSIFSSNSSSTQPGAGFGGGVIMGVASSSPKKSIREFNHKNHYNQWLFFYSANYDGAVEVKGPTPPAPVFASPQGSPAQGTSPTGQGQGGLGLSNPPTQQQNPQTTPLQSQ
jgi:type II secretory pathway pseudopilin PulG